MLQKIKKLFNQEKIIDIYFENIKVARVPKKSIKMSRETQRREVFYFVAWDKRHKKSYSGYENIKLDTIPYIDNETSNLIYFNIESGQVEDVHYIVDGLSESKIKIDSPTSRKFSNGIMKSERYLPFLLHDNLKDEYPTRTAKHTCELNSYTIPEQITYKEDGSIDEIESYWKFNITQKETKIMKFEEYKEILKDININLYNFKNHTKIERKLIHIYMRKNLYKKEFEELGIDLEKESLLTNLEIIEMYYL